MQENPPDEVISVDDTDVVPVDITDISPEVELSTEPPSLSTHHVTPCSEFSQATSHSPPPSPIARDVDCSESDTSSWHAGTRERPHLHTANKIKESHKRTLGPGDVAALPSSCSQHVRGLQHSYTCGQAPPKRSICSSSCPPGEGTLDFLTKLRQLDDTPSIPLARICRSLTWTPQQCEEHLQSLSRDYIESHPAFAQILVQRGRIPLRHSTETWTRRFRPRRANEVLGNEQQALYLRDWLRALELRSQDCQLEEPASQRARENKDKGTSRRIPRGTKRPRVVRAVTRKRSKKKRVASDDDLDDFVVFSDVDEEETDDPPEDSEDELAFCQRTLSRLHRRGTSDIDEGDPIALKVPVTATNHAVSPSLQRAQANFTDNLTNTILITGPPGCGKTAAVYACAEELGWEVFEVYPGIGRRNGASLDHLVGDVGKNHIVQTVHRRAVTKARVGLDGYLAKGKARQLGGISKTQEAGTEGQPITVEDGSPTHAERPLPQDREMGPSDETGISGTCQEESQGSRPNVRQSLVLLEEVDILFKDDAGFWPAVVEFIQNCQRPVVMTCNGGCVEPRADGETDDGCADAGLVPVGELPLQKVLVFEPCASPVAATFLQCVSLAEGCLVPHEDLVVLYESTHAIDGLDTPDAPLYPRTEPLPLPDLRRCITQLQILCAGTRQGSASEKHQGDEAGGHARRSARAISAGSRDESEWWWQMKRESELMSHVDAELCRTGVGTREVSAAGTGAADADGYADGVQGGGRGDGVCDAGGGGGGGGGGVVLRA